MQIVVDGVDASSGRYVFYDIVVDGTGEQASVESVRQLVLDNGVIDGGVAHGVERQKERSVGPHAVAIVDAGIVHHCVEEPVAFSLADGVDDGVPHAAGRRDDNGVVGGVLAGTVGEGGDEPYGICPWHVVMEGVAFGGSAAVAEVPFVTLAGQGGQPRVFGVVGDDAFVGELIALYAIVGIDQLGGELGIGIAKSGNGFHHHPAGGPEGSLATQVTTIDTAVGHRDGSFRREGAVGVFLAVPTIGETDGGGELVFNNFATIG